MVSMNEEEFINDFYKGSDYRKFAVLKEMYSENENLKKENKLLKQLKAKIIDGDDDIELEYDLGDYLCSVDCCLRQNHEICELKKKIKKLKQDYKCVKNQRDDISKNATETIEKCIDENKELKSQLQSKKQELNGFVTTISKYLEFEESEHTTYVEIIEKIVNLKGSAIKLQQRDEVIKETIKFVKSLSSKGRDCMIYADVKKDILDILNKYKNVGD